jgi:hypothetical protein
VVTDRWRRRAATSWSEARVAKHRCRDRMPQQKWGGAATRRSDARMADGGSAITDTAQRERNARNGARVRMNTTAVSVLGRLRVRWMTSALSKLVRQRQTCLPPAFARDVNPARFQSMSRSRRRTMSPPRNPRRASSSRKARSRSPREIAIAGCDHAFHVIGGQKGRQGREAAMDQNRNRPSKLLAHQPSAIRNWSNIRRAVVRFLAPATWRCDSPPAQTVAGFEHPTCRVLRPACVRSSRM